MLEIDKSIKSSIINIQFQIKNQSDKPLATEMTAPPVSLPSEKGKSALSRMSESQLWEMQAAYYQAHGVEDWGLELTAPAFLTNTVFLGECYAELIISFLNEYHAKLDLSQPLYILELGTGSGRFSYQFLTELSQKLDHFEKLKSVQIKYVMSDFSEKNCKFWENHAHLKPFVEKGLLDFAHYDPLKSEALELRLSKKVLKADTMANPLIVLSNGFFDSIPQDVFQVSEKILNEGLVQLFLKLPEQSIEQPKIEDVDVITRFKAADSSHYYSNEAYNGILKSYHEALSVQEGQHTFLFPVGALDAIEQVKKLSNKGFMLFASDRALTHLEANIQMEQLSNHLSGKTLSHCVNYDILSRYFESTAAKSILTEHDGWPLQTICAYQLPEAPPLEQLRYVFHNRLQRMNMLNTLCCVPTHMNDTPEAHVAYWLSYMRVHMSEPAIFAHIGDLLVPRIASFRPEQKRELLRLMEDSWKHFYYSSGENNTPFIFSKLYFALKEFQLCISALEQTIHWFGDHVALRCFKAEVFAQWGRREEAKAECEKALELEANHELAVKLLEKLAT